jgi:antirestriction protein
MSNYTKELTGQEMADYIAQRFNKPQEETKPMKTIDTSGFFYIDGIPTKGTWVDLQLVTDWADIKAELGKALHIDGNDIDEILCADVEGLARHFYASNCDSLDLDSWIDFKDDLERSHIDAEIADAYLENCGSGSVSDIEDAFTGEYKSWSDFAYDMAENCFSIPEEISAYFDYDKFGHDLSFDYFESNGYFFRNC